MSKRFETLEELESWLRSPQRREYVIQYICVEGGRIILVANKKTSSHCLAAGARGRSRANAHALLRNRT
jgi:hypothetical protein